MSSYAPLGYLTAPAQGHGSGDAWWCSNRRTMLTQGIRDDLTIQVIFFGYGEHKTWNLKLIGDDPNSSDTLDLA